METPHNQMALSNNELQTWAALATVVEWLPAALDAQLHRDSDLAHFEYGIMFALSGAADRTLRMSTLAGFSNSSLSRLSRAVARLETRRWVSRKPDPSDGRYTLATLTDSGSAKVDEAAPGHVATVRRLIFDPLTTNQVKQLLEISRRISAAIGDGEAWTPLPLS